MGVAEELDYRLRAPNIVQRWLQAMASTRGGAWTFARVLPPVDRAVDQFSKGRTSVPRLLAGLPIVMITTTGRKSGQARTTPLIAVPAGPDLAVIGTRFGQAATPAWVLNLEADARAVLEHAGHRCEVVARPATPEEADSVWARAAQIYPGYPKYRQRITGR
ncbi:MAG: nitroreductase family deazaflavin-dependent oxidoreductase, partial [Candidatus Nanopelagicales bacterium]